MSSLELSAATGSGVVGDAGPVGRAMGSVTALRSTPVKGLRLGSLSEVVLTDVGARDDRCFFIVDDRGRLVNGKRIAALSAVRADYDAGADRLELVFPGGQRTAADVALAGAITTRFFSRHPTAQLVDGPFSAALSDYAGQPLRLVRADPALGGVDRGPRGGVSLISSASIASLAARAGRDVDARRFRMLIEIDGVSAHQEDALVGGRARIGGAVVAFHGHVGRCLVTTQNPDTGRVDLPTLELLAYRRGLSTSEPLAFGVYGAVLAPGLVRLGDSITVHPAG